MKTNWSKIVAHYITDETLSYQDLAKRHGISIDAIKEHARKDRWVALRQENKQKIHQLLPTLIGETLVQINERHIRVAQMLQQKGLDAIENENTKPNNFRDAKESILSGVSLERKALALDEEFNQKPEVTVVLPQWWLDANPIPPGK